MNTLSEARTLDLPFHMRTNRPFPSSLVLLFQSESKYENDFGLHENKTACRTHFHMTGFALVTRFETEAQENSEMAYYILALGAQDRDEWREIAAALYTLAGLFKARLS